MSDLYKKYYEACQRNDEWAEVDKAELRQRIQRQREAESYSGEKYPVTDDSWGPTNN